MNKELAMFDLDGVLWNIKNDDIWIIDKDKPYKPVLILDPLEFQLIQNGKFKKDDLKLDYNGNIFYISKELLERIKKKSGSENMERFGISFIPQIRKEILDKREVDILSHNIEHLRYKKFIDIGLLTARSNQPNHANLLNKLRLELKKIGIEISKIFFTGSSDPKKKVFVLLEHLVGLKIKEDRFVSVKQDWYEKVSFYDDDIRNIDQADDIQTTFEELLRKTDDEIFRIIVDRITSFDLTLETYLVVDNEVNRFKKNKIILKEPLRFPLQEKKKEEWAGWKEIVKKAGYDSKKFDINVPKLGTWQWGVDNKEENIGKYVVLKGYDLSLDDFEIEHEEENLNEFVRCNVGEIVSACKSGGGIGYTVKYENVPKNLKHLFSSTVIDIDNKYLVIHPGRIEFISSSKNECEEYANKFKKRIELLKNKMKIHDPYGEEKWLEEKSIINYKDFLLENKRKKPRTKWFRDGKLVPEPEIEYEEEEDEFDPQIGIKNLIGKTLSGIEVGDEIIIFKTVGGSRYMMYHEQDCCESVCIDDIVGDIEDLIGNPIIKASEDTNKDVPPPHGDYDGSYTWTFYNISTIKGHVTIRWFGSSNGCYSESVDFAEINEDGNIIWQYPRHDDGG